jgi:hypothetical protein
MFSALQELPFREIWAVDFEFNVQPGQNPDPVCMSCWPRIANQQGS